MASAEWKDFAKPDEVRTFPHGRIELLHIGGGTVGRMTLEPGWRWSTDVKPIAGTEWCEAPHFQYMVSGRIHVKMKDGTEADLGAGHGPSPPGRARRLGRRQRTRCRRRLVRRHQLREEEVEQDRRHSLREAACSCRKNGS